MTFLEQEITVTKNDLDDLNHVNYFLQKSYNAAKEDYLYFFLV